MKLQRYSIDEDRDLEKDDKWGRLCLDEDVEPLEAENAELHAECDRLTNLLQWEQGRRESIGTHGDECWKWGPAIRMLLAEKSEELPVIGELTPIKMPEV